MKKWQIAVSILLVFALGTAVGAYGSRIVFKKRVSEALRTDGTPGIKVIQGRFRGLDLSEAQRASINTILDENNKKWETIRQEYEPQIRDIFEAAIEETKKVLTAEQQKEIEHMSDSVQRRLRPRTSTLPGTSSPPRSSAPPESSIQPRSSTPPETSSPQSKGQRYGPQLNSKPVDDILEQLQIDKGKSTEIQSIIEADMLNQEALRDEFQKSQATAEEKFRKETAELQMLTEKKLENLLTPEQMETYRRLMSPDEPPPDDFGFDTPDGGSKEPKDPKNFKQGDAPLRPEGKQGAAQGSWTL